jgi:hypothetical protein
MTLPEGRSEMPKTYELREVAALLEKPARQIRRWADIGIIPVAGGGSQGLRREFTQRNLVEIAICDQLRRVGVPEPVFGVIVQTLDWKWQRDPPGELFRTWVNVLWVRFPHAPEYEDVTIDNIAAKGREPAVMLVPASDVQVDVLEGFFGIALPLLPIVQDLEQKTGETFA